MSHHAREREADSDDRHRDQRADLDRAVGTVGHQGRLLEHHEDQYDPHGAGYEPDGPVEKERGQGLQDLRHESLLFESWKNIA